MIYTERGILAAVILENSLTPILLANADKTLFSSDYNQITFEEIKRLHNEGQFFDFLILVDKLTSKIKMPYTYMCDLMACLPHSSLKFLLRDLKQHINTLKREWARKEILKEVNHQAKEPNVSLDGLQNIISKANIVDTEIETGDVEECFKEFDQMSERNKAITLGFPTLDKIIGGFHYGEVLLFMGRTTVGKTFWALNVLLYMLSHTQEKIALFSLEMPRPEVLVRLAQINFSLSRQEAIEKLKTNREIRQQLEDKIRNLEIYAQNYSIDEIELKIKEDGSRIVLIDYLDLIREQSSKNQSRYERVSNLIVESKRMTKRQNVLLIILHQLHRQAEGGGVPVKLTMARDSGVIEEASDFILGAWRPELGYDDKNKIPKDMRNRLFIKLLKNKRGPTQIISCFFEKRTGKIREVEWNDRLMEMNQ